MTDAEPIVVNVSDIVGVFAGLCADIVKVLDDEGLIDMVRVSDTLRGHPEHSPGSTIIRRLVANAIDERALKPEARALRLVE